MDKRSALTIAGVAVVVAVIWLTTRPGESPAESGPSPATEAGVAVAAANDAVASSPPLGSAARAADPAKKTAAEASTAMPSGATPTVQATGEILPIDVSPGFEFLSKPAAEMKDTDSMWTQWRRHQKLESEPRDEAWAPRMEAALRNGIQSSLMAHGLDAQRIELPVVECRSTGCEIQAIGYEEDSRRGGVDFQAILHPLLNGSLAGEFDISGFGLMMSPRPDGRVTFLTHLPRKGS
jgi:hypothetical protein